MSEQELTFDELKTYVRKLQDKFDDFVNASRNEVGTLKILTKNFEGYKEFDHFLNVAQEWESKGLLLTESEKQKKEKNGVWLNMESERFIKPITTLRKEIARQKDIHCDYAKRGRNDKVRVYSSSAKQIHTVSLFSLQVDDIKYGVRRALEWCADRGMEDEVHHLVVSDSWGGWKVKVWKTENKKVLDDYILHKSLEAL